MIRVIKVALEVLTVYQIRMQVCLSVLGSTDTFKGSSPQNTLKYKSLHSRSLDSCGPQRSGQEHRLQNQAFWGESQSHHLAAVVPYFSASLRFSLLICDVLIVVPASELCFVNYVKTLPGTA